MRPNGTPTIATWLLRYLGASPNNDSVIGDLIERYQQGRSPLWFWRQTVNAIASGLWSQIMTHKWRTLRAVALGWICLLLLMSLLIECYLSLFLRGETFSRYNPSNWWTQAGSQIQYYDWLFALIAPFAVHVLCGWLVARANRLSQRAMVLAFLASRCAHALMLVCFLLVGMVVEPQYLRAFITLVFANIISLPGILLGGLFGGPSEVHSSGHKIAT